MRVDGAKKCAFFITDVSQAVEMSCSGILHHCMPSGVDKVENNLRPLHSPTRDDENPAV